MLKVRKLLLILIAVCTLVIIQFMLPGCTVKGSHSYMKESDALIKQGRYKEAMMVYDEAAKRFPYLEQRVWFLERRIKLKEQMGNRAGAQGDREKIAEIERRKKRELEEKRRRLDAITLYRGKPGTPLEVQIRQAFCSFTFSSTQMRQMMRMYRGLRITTVCSGIPASIYYNRKGELVVLRR